MSIKSGRSEDTAHLMSLVCHNSYDPTSKGQDRKECGEHQRAPESALSVI